MKKLRRTRSYQLSLELADDGFVRPPHESQRHWLLNRFMREADADLQALHERAARFAPGGDRAFPDDMRTADLADQEIMEDWQLPLMQAMAGIVGRRGGHVLEVGFGRGVSATMLQEHGVESHTIIECNPSVVERFERWRQDWPGRDIRMVEGLWQDVIHDLGRFDAVFFHTYALDEGEAVDYLAGSVTFAAHFFPTAAEHLVDGGVFTYLTNEIDSLGREHQRLLFRHFSSVRIEVVRLDVPPDVKDAWWADAMAVVEVVK